jgi:chromosome segregation ATPase
MMCIIKQYKKIIEATYEIMNIKDEQINNLEFKIDNLRRINSDKTDTLDRHCEISKGYKLRIKELDEELLDVNATVVSLKATIRETNEYLDTLPKLT